MPLSDILVRNLKTKPKAYKIGDFEGLFVLVKVSGSKSWRFKYRLDGKEGLLVIGDYPAISLAQARKAKVAVRALVAQGIDPNEAKQEAKSVYRKCCLGCWYRAESVRDALSCLPKSVTRIGHQI